MSTANRLRVLYPLLALSAALAPSRSAVAADVVAEKGDDRVVFKVGGTPAAEYRFGGEVRAEKGTGTKPLAKPFVYPLVAPNGAAVTRGWPVVRGAPGETTDHVHQKSVWFCHGDVIPEGVELKTRSADPHVKGVDFWSENAGHGRIVATAVGPAAAVPGGVAVPTHNEWLTADRVKVLDEDRTVTFRPLPAGHLIVFEIELAATVCPVTFGDTKEGSLGVRVADEVRLARKGGGVVTSADGTAVAAPAKDNLPVWGRLADWNDYSGTVGGKPAGVAIFDDPANRSRAAWHTRAYGLMAANPFARSGSGFPARQGQADLVRLARGEKLKLRYGVYAHDGDAKAGRVAEAFAAFAGK